MFYGKGTLGQLLRATASGHPTALAVHQGDLRLTYRELDGQVDRFASHLLRQGIKKGDRVAYIFFNQWEILVAYHAITRIGGVIVSLNYRLTADEIQYQLEKSEAVGLVYDTEFVDLVESLPDAVKAKLHRVVSGDAALGTADIAFNDALAIDADLVFEAEKTVGADDDSGVWFTSGTTGMPKGAVVRHSSSIAAAVLTSQACRIANGCRFLSVAPLFHRGAMEDMHLAVTMVGGTHYLEPRFDPVRTLAAIEEHKITHAFIVPTMSRMIIAVEDCGRYDLTSMERYISASAPLPGDLVEAIYASLKLNKVVVNAYGITESLLNASCQPEELIARPGTVGRAVAQTRLRIIDEERRACDAGTVGEIAMSGPSAFRCYMGDDEATKAVTFEDASAPWYCSGDVGYLDGDGFLYIVDRKKDMIITGGENVYCVEVEGAIARSGLVSEVAVVGRPDKKWGEVVVAVVVARPTTPKDADTIINACTGLATYKRPKEVLFVEEMPKNSFGKIQKATLRTMLKAPAEG